MRRIAKRLGQQRNVRERLVDRIVAEVRKGRITRDELAAIVIPGARPEQRHSFNVVIARLIRLGRLREVPMLPQCSGHAVRVIPVKVLEVVE